MIDRSYLPFQSAREHQDRGMAKWMGFFLSEHTTSLVDERNKVNLSTDLTMGDKLMLLGQLYVGKLRARLVVKSKQQRLSLYGEVVRVSSSDISFETKDGYQRINIGDILRINLTEEVEYE